MRDAHGDQIPPGTFLYIAERLGLIQEIDRWVVARAIDLLAEHRADGRDLRFEVNLSGHTIGDPELLELIERRLRRDRRATRPADLRDHRDRRRRQHRPRRRRSPTAYPNSAATSRSMTSAPDSAPSTTSSTCRSTTSRSTANSSATAPPTPTDRILISAVVQIARGMGKHTIAEFVGDQESVEVLTELGVDYGQGYFLGRPEPLADHLARQPARTAFGSAGGLGF